MELTFDYYKNAQDAEIYLCNPDKSLLGALYAKNKNVILRFNSISELTFEVPKYVSNSAGEMIEHPYYERIATKRLVKVDKIGWFRIIQAVETENATGAVKAVTAESHQAVFKDMGFVEENRLYKFYDATDIYDEKYNPDDAGAIPSVVGQLYQQLGITCDLNIGDITPTIDYGKWKIIWIEEALRYSPAKAENVCRTLKGSDGLFGYDFMVTNVEDAFQVIFEFDFLHHAIKVKSAASVAEKTNIYLSFENLVQELALTEKSDEIVTVLSCKGTDLDITSVNPMGTNYICDFSYFMGDETNGYPWMSKALTDKLIDWKANVDAAETTYSGYVAKLQDLYLEKTEYESKKTFVDLKLKDTEEVRDQYINNQTLATSYFGAETVETGEKSRESSSVFHTAGFSKDSAAMEWKCYAVPPVYDTDTNSYAFESEDCKTGTTLANCFAQDPTYLYFMDGDTKSYCKIKQGTSVEDGKATYFVDGFERFTAYKNNGYWYDLYAAENKTIDDNIARITGNETTPNTIKYVLAKMSEIAEQTNILTYFTAYPTLFDELKCYWVDGQYTNDTLKAADGTTVAENLELAKELMDAGKTELNRVCQPRFSFTVTSANFLKMPQFLKFAREIALGKVVTVEKNENTHYFPALTEMAFSLDTSENFSLTFSNSLKLTDWGYTYADLIKSASSTTRTVESNWSNLMDYSQSKEQINQMLYNTLDRTLRAGMDNAYAQDFVIDNSGILGRKKREDGTFEDCQVRMTNNLLVFTRDNWQTACTALGQIYYDNPDGTPSEGYGLATEVLVGKMIIGENLWIGNESGSVQIDADGIVISNGSISSADYIYSEASLPYSLNGIKIDLGNEPYIKTPNFAIEPNGDAYFKGDITVENLTLNIDAAIGGALQSKNFAYEDLETTTNNIEVDSEVIEYKETGSLISGYRYSVVQITGSITFDNPINIVESFTVNSATLKSGYEGCTLTNLLYEQPTYTIAGSTINFTFKSRYRSSRSYALLPVVDSCSVTIKVSQFKAKTGLKINFGDNPYILSTNFSLDADGIITAVNANISGYVNATSGKIGAFDITGDGLESEHIKLNSQSIYFPTQSVFNLSNNVTIFNEDNVSYIATSGERDFEIRNITGAGIRFKALEESEAVVQQIVFGTFTYKEELVTTEIDMDASYTRRICSLTIPWKVGSSGVLSMPQHYTIYCRHLEDYPGAIFGAGASKDYKTIEISLDIPAFTHQGSFTVQIRDARKASTCTFYGVSKTYSETNSDFSMNNISFDCLNISVTNNVLYSLGSFCPNESANGTTSGYLLGDDSHVWGSIRAYTSSITTSDRREKNNIALLTEKHEKFFDGLSPATFVYEHADSGRTHLGFIAQDVEDSLLEAGLTTMDFAGVCVGNDENKTYGLRYEEFIALNTSQIQKLKRRVAELEKELKEIKGNET